MIETVRVTGSTNADLIARLSGGEPVREGDWLVADRQDAGRGRQGRAWFDGLGNFMGSTVVRLAPGDPPAPTLALLIGLMVHEVASSHVPAPHRVMLKWPNDLIVARAPAKADASGNQAQAGLRCLLSQGLEYAKLGGILLERVGEAIVAGIGVNLAAAPDLPDRATIALSRFGPAPDRDHFASELARIFASELERWRTFGLEPLLLRWLAAAHPLGTPLTVSETGLSGTFAGLAADGALQLRLPDGTTRTIHAGEINLAAN